MWIKYIFIVLLFYLFSILQNSFFVHFSLFGAIPNLVFVFFFLLAFFEPKNNHYQIVFYAISAGLFLDFFSYTYFGVSIILLLLIGSAMKKIQAILHEKRDDRFPLLYFLPLFTISLIFYDLLLNVFLNKFNLAQIVSGFSISEIIYNLLFASVAFYVYKKFLGLRFDDRQLALFR